MRLVLANEGQHGSRWQAVMSIAAKIGCAPQTPKDWVKKAEVDGGKRADLVLFRGDAEQPYDALLSASPLDLELVMVDGRALYGTLELKAAASPTPSCEEISLCGTTKFLCVAESSTANKLNQTYAEIVGVLTSNLTSYDTMSSAMGVAPVSPIAPLLKCP